MKRTAKKTKAGQQHAAAPVLRDTTKDPAEALGRCRTATEGHLETQEAEAPRSRIQAIVGAVVPKHEPIDAQVELAAVHVAHGRSPRIAANPDATGVVELPGGTP